LKKRSFYDEISGNKRDSILLVIFVFGSVVFLGWFIGWFYNPSFASIAIISASVLMIIMSWVGYYHSDRIVLSTINAVPASQSKYRKLHDLTDGLCIGAGMPKPRLYVIKSPDINAFATGRDPEHAVIGITEGALEYLDRDELEGVLAHELSHIRNYDIRFMTLVATMVGTIVIISEIFRMSLWYGRRGSSRDSDSKGSGVLLLVGLLFAIIAPIMMKLVQLAVSRKREYLADSSAVEIGRNPDGLADALAKIKTYNSNKLKTSQAVHHLFISNPVKGRDINRLLSTHPPVDERIKRLRSM